VYITADAARFLASRGVRTVGVDYLSVGGYKEGTHETHEILLEAGIWIIEGLNLSKVEPGRYDLACLPLRIANGDGAPARAAVRKR
jgi:arylformamidase